jgi:transcriptional regulator with XRE-family HTH domain
MMKLYQIADFLGVDKGNLSKMLSGKRKVSWPFAQQLAGLFPLRDVVSWRNATPKELQELQELCSQLKSGDIKPALNPANPKPNQKTRKAEVTA